MALMELCRNHHGNAYAQIDTSDPKQPKLWPINPEKVRVWYDNALAFDKIPDVYYQVTDNGGMRVLSSEEVLHFKSHLTVDGLVGISVREQLLTDRLLSLAQFARHPRLHIRYRCIHHHFFLVTFFGFAGSGSVGLTTSEAASL